LFDSADEGIVTWISKALRERHAPRKRFRDEAVTKLKKDHLRPRKRLDVMTIG
jgi:hypothetical protein